jgi:hypothetical protein
MVWVIRQEKKVYLVLTKGISEVLHAVLVDLAVLDALFITCIKGQRAMVMGNDALNGFSPWIAEL